MAVIVGIAVVLMAVGAYAFGVVSTTRIQVRKSMREYGIDRGTAKRYRKAAKILHDLVHVNDLDELMPVLPAAMQKRIEEWNNAHREAINNGT